MRLSGEHFVEEGLISSEQLQQAIAKQRELGGSEPIAKVLVGMGLIGERDRVRCLGKVWGVQFVDIHDIVAQPEALKKVNAQTARKFKAIPIEIQGGRLVVAMANPLDVFAIDDLRLSTGLDIEPVISVEDDIKLAISSYYRSEGSV